MEKKLSDSEIREPLFDFLEDTYGKLRVFEEKQIGKTRADVMIILQEKIIGLEIKSDKDTYARIDRQIPDYNKFFDENYVCVGSSHAHSIDEHVPEWWGIIVVEYIEPAGFDFYIKRRPTNNPRPDKRRKLKRQLGFLWRPELNHILDINNFPGYRQMSKRFIIDKLMEKLEADVLKKQLTDELFERDYELALKEIAEYKAAHKTINKRKSRVQK